MYTSLSDETENLSIMQRIQKIQRILLQKRILIMIAIAIIIAITLILNSMTKTTSTIYCLKLEDNKYYIGMTTNFQNRYAQHLKGNGALWTKRYHPIDIIMTKQIYRKDAPCEETRTTCMYMNLYGFQNVRGAEYAEDRIYNDIEIKRINFSCKHHLNTE